jgi:tight adherence protein B
MLNVILLVFGGVFALVALVLIASGSNAADKSKKVLASLDSALATETPQARDTILNLRKQESLSSIPWLHQRLQQFELAPYLQRMLEQGEMKWTTGTLLTMTLAGFVVPAYVVFMYFHSLLLCIPAGLAIGVLPFSWVMFRRGRRFDTFQKELPEALDLMVSGLRAGHSLIAAMGLVARECADPIGSEFRTCFEEQNYGLELKTALDNMLNRIPIQDLRIMCTAILIQKESGGNLAEVLDKTAHTIRERFRLKREVATHTAQGRLTGWVLTLLPIALGIALYFVNPTMMSILWTRDLGIKLLEIASVMIVIGGFIIRHIVNMDV